MGKANDVAHKRGSEDKLHLIVSMDYMCVSGVEGANPSLVVSEDGEGYTAAIPAASRAVRA